MEKKHCIVFFAIVYKYFTSFDDGFLNLKYVQYIMYSDIAHLRQECHNSKIAIFQENLLKVLKCYNFL